MYCIYIKNTVTLNSFYEVYNPIKKIVALGLIFCMPLKRAKTYATAYNKHMLNITRREIKKKKGWFDLAFRKEVFENIL